MGKAVLLTGKPGSGKTTLIKTLLERLPYPAGGFYTQEIRQAGTRKGFQIVTLEGIEATLAHVELKSPWRVGKYGVDLSVLDGLAVDSITSAMRDKQLLIIDEIGPMELLSQKFRQAVLEALKSQITMLGTIVERKIPFTEKLKSLPNVTVIQVRRDNFDATANQMLAYLARYLNHAQDEFSQ